MRKLNSSAVLGKRLAGTAMPIAQLARQAGISYQRLWGGSQLSEAEVQLVLAILDQTESDGHAAP